MKLLILAHDDCQLFNTDISPIEYEFYYRHRDAFRRMWMEQGETELSFLHPHGPITSFQRRPVSQVKQLFEDIVTTSQSRNLLTYLNSISRVKDPFYRKDTKNIYKQFFGDPSHKSSYFKVYVLLPLYEKFAGSLCVCLRRWLDAPDMTDTNDTSYWIPPGDYNPFEKTKLFDDITKITSEETDALLAKELACGSPTGPMFMEWWAKGCDPRFHEPANPLYDSTAKKGSDWRTDLNIERFSKFVLFVEATDTLATRLAIIKKSVVSQSSHAADESCSQGSVSCKNDVEDKTQRVCTDLEFKEYILDVLAKKFVTMSCAKDQHELLHNITKQSDCYAGSSKRGNKKSGRGGLSDWPSLADEEEQCIRKASAKKKGLVACEESCIRKMSDGVYNDTVSEIKKNTGSDSQTLSSLFIPSKEDGTSSSKASSGVSTELNVASFQTVPERRIERTNKSMADKRPVKGKDNYLQRTVDSCDRDVFATKTVVVEDRDHGDGVVRVQLRSNVLVEKDGDSYIVSINNVDDVVSSLSSDVNEALVKTFCDKAIMRNAADIPTPVDETVTSESFHRICSRCQKQELTGKKLQKCKRCKEEGVKLCMYYCGRDCQLADWSVRHKYDHRKVNSSSTTTQPSTVDETGIVQCH